MLGFQAMLEESDFAAAAGHIEAALKSNPRNYQALLAAGALAYNLGRTILAIRIGKYITSRDPMGFWGHSNLGDAYLANGEASEAVASSAAAAVEVTRAEDVGMSTERLEYLTSYFEGLVEDQRSGGFQLLVSRRGKVVPQIVRDAYGNENFEFGPRYIIPKPFDPRILTYVVPAVAQAAMESGVAGCKIDIVEYGHQLSKTAAVLANM